MSGFCLCVGVNAETIRQWCAEHPECKYILGFNEPNFKAQANMTPAQAAEKWPELVSLARELGLKIVAPALNYSPDAPYTDPSKWMTEFSNLVGKDAYDFTAIHCYGGVDVLKRLATQFHDLYGKPVWVTEFCNWPGGAGNVYVSPSAQISSMIASLEWLEKTEWIYRYSWFKAVGDYDAANKPNYGLLKSTAGYGEKELSPQGWVYVYMTDFDPEVWNVPEKIVAASEYIASSAVVLDKGENAACPRPIEISQFNAGATADYQFDIPKAGKYILTLTVSGQGEPTRFDPNLAVLLTDGEGNVSSTLAETGAFTLSGDNVGYTEVNITLDLAAGKQTLRLADNNPMRPSGIRISTLKLSDAAGVADCLLEVAAEEYYDLMGRKVDASRLAPGIYVTSLGKKVMVK